MKKSSGYLFGKRLMDIIVSLLLFIAFIPAWIIVPLAIYLDSGLPIFFRHKRVGLGGKEFYLWKFRSMVPNADQILHHGDNDLLQKFKKDDWKIKVEEDPRITRLGKLLRQLTIDEFPQLWNVLIDDTPRPGSPSARGPGPRPCWPCRGRRRRPPPSPRRGHAGSRAPVQGRGNHPDARPGGPTGSRAPRG